MKNLLKSLILLSTFANNISFGASCAEPLRKLRGMNYLHARVVYLEKNAAQANVDVNGFNAHDLQSYVNLNDFQEQYGKRNLVFQKTTDRFLTSAVLLAPNFLATSSKQIGHFLEISEPTSTMPFRSYVLHSEGAEMSSQNFVLSELDCVVKVDNNNKLKFLMTATKEFSTGYHSMVDYENSNPRLASWTVSLHAAMSPMAVVD